MPRLVGLLSDSHGRAPTTQRAISLLIEQQVEVILHLGDIGTLEVIDALVERIDSDGRLEPPVHMVFGNCDWDSTSLGRYAEQLGVHVHDPAGRLEIEDRTIVFQHGHLDSIMRQALAEEVDYLCHGHTHRPGTERVGNTLIINPGALFRAADYTVATLEVETAQVSFYSVRDI
jgi:hypothetical protein